MSVPPRFPCPQMPSEMKIAKLMGIYPQAQDGRFFQRVCIPGGHLTGRQWCALAQLARQLTPSTPLHLTTRQDIEIHDLSAGQIPSAQQAMASAGLTCVGAGGDSVRNITVCPCSGLMQGCPDLHGLADLAAAAVREIEGVFALPRKFKISFSACSNACGRPFINDLGFVLARRDGAPGFRVIAGGSLGPNPATGIELFDLLPAEQVLGLVKAAVIVFNEHGDRTNRSKARLRHIRQRVGDDAFRKLLLEELEKQVKTDTGSAGRGNGSAEGTGSVKGTGSAGKGTGSAAIWRCLSPLSPRPEDRGPKTEDQRPVQAGTGAFSANSENDEPVPFSPGPAGFAASLPLTFVDGDLSPAAADVLADLADAPGTAVRITTDHRVMLYGASAAHLSEAVGRHSVLAPAATPQPTIVTCPGNRWCSRGLIDTQRLAGKVREIMLRPRDGNRHRQTTAESVPFARAVICISGCPNGCSHSRVADIGVTGMKAQAEGVGELGAARQEAYSLFLDGGRGITDALATPAGTRLNESDLLEQIAAALKQSSDR